MGRVSVSLAAMLLAASPAAFANQFAVSANSETAVTLSNHDVNRLVCTNGDIEDVKFSAEKGIIVEHSGSDAYIKFQIRETGDHRDYVQERSEFFVKCAGEVYTIYGEPKDIPAATVFLSNGGHDQSAANQKLLGALPEEERAVSISLAILKDEIPGSFKVIEDHGPWQPFIDGLEISQVRRVEIDGMGLGAREYYVRAIADRRLNEVEFLDGRFGNSIFGVTLKQLDLKAGQATQAVIVTRGRAE